MHPFPPKFKVIVYICALRNFDLLLKTVKIHTLVLYLFIFLTACGEGTINKQENKESLKEGPDLFLKYGCFACHSLKGEVLYGPALDGLYMKDISVDREGRLINLVANREYLNRAITDPSYEKVNGFQGKLMPHPDISQGDADILIDYIISLPKVE